MQSNFKIFEIQRPLRLIDHASTQESDEYTEISKRMQTICNAIKDERYISKSNSNTNSSRSDVVNAFFDVRENTANVYTLAKRFCTFKNIETPVHRVYFLLLEAIKEFSIHADRKINYIVPIPINYLLKKLDFTGVSSSTNDRFNRGLVAIELEDTTDLAFIPVKPLTYDQRSSH